MLSCTFFGHRDCKESIKPLLLDAIEKMITSCGVSTFYVGNHGNFDIFVLQVLRKLKEKYPQILFWVVLSDMPCGDLANVNVSKETILPSGIENVPKRFAILYRNNWMIKNSNYVITYITHSYGGAAQFAQKAKRLKRTVINLAN